MNLLPFVISFLLILVIGSTAFFASLRGTLLEKKTILAKHHGLLLLISEEANKKYKETKSTIPTPFGKEKKKKRKEKGKFPDLRRSQQHFTDGKFNLWPLITSDTTPESKLFYEKAVNLIEILYREADFYQIAKDPNLARKIVNNMCGRGATTFHELFPDDPALAKVYYKMVQGTNTGYPALEDYFKIDPGNKKIQFRYATAEVLKAVFGDELTHQIIQKEYSKWESDDQPYILKKEELNDLIKPSSSFDVNHLDILFDFQLKKEGIQRAIVDEESKVMAKR
jgi:hypothetical protein